MTLKKIIARIILVPIIAVAMVAVIVGWKVFLLCAAMMVLMFLIPWAVMEVIS